MGTVDLMLLKVTVAVAVVVRIAINYTSNTYTGTISANGGLGPDGATDGENGSIYPNEVSFNTSISDITSTSAKVSTEISQLGVTGLSRYGHIVRRTDLQLDPSLPPIYTQYALGEPTPGTGLIFEDQISLHGTLYSGTTVEINITYSFRSYWNVSHLTEVMIT
jgi:hypothetical protein